MVWSPTIRAALVAGTPWLDVFCPGWGTSRAIDLRTVDRHPLASVGTRVRKLRCSWCPSRSPMKGGRARAATYLLCDFDHVRPTWISAHAHRRRRALPVPTFGPRMVWMKCSMVGGDVRGLLGCLASGPVAAGELPVWVFLTCTRANWRCAPFAVNRLNNIHLGLQSYASGLIELSSGTYRAKSLGRARHFDFRRCSGQECWPLAP
jgi:hypothetical protein